MIKIAFQRYTKILAVLAGVVLIYAAAGFWLLPSFLQKQIPGWGVATLDRKVSVQAIAFNPFTLRLKVDGLGLAENDDTPVLTIARADVALEWASLVRGAWRFSELHLSSPELQLKVSKNGVFNMAQWIESYEERNPSSSNVLPRLLIQQFQITDGKIHFQDQQSGYQNQFDPVEFKVLLEFLMMKGSPNYGISNHPAEYILTAPKTNITAKKIYCDTFEEYFTKNKDFIYLFG
jgi:uncharacterized protein involved in outer membrane biogenesis